MMDHSFGRSDALQRDLRVQNQRAERDLQHRVNMLDKQYRFTRKMLQQRRESVTRAGRRVVMVKFCEPKATVNIAMKEIEEHQNAETHVRDDRRLHSSKSQHHDTGSGPVEPGRSVSAPPVKHRGNIQSSLSLMQMKNIATIDSISEKELSRRQQEAREEMERMRRFQQEALHRRVTAFIESLKDKCNTQTHVDPP